MVRLACTVLLALSLATGLASGADIEEGKVLKYYSFDPKTGVIPEGLPALTIEDLRKITLYSELTLKGGKLDVADKKHMRRIEPIVTDPTLLTVTSDHFRFTVLKNGVIDPKLIPEKYRAQFRFLWIKHVTHESPDGAPWLKDLVLLPCDPKTGKLLGPWPFQDWTEVGKNAIADVFFLDNGDPRPAIAKAPAPEASLVGTFDDGKKMRFLVIDVFGNYSWWGKVTQLEFAALRGKSKEVLDAFHKDSNPKVRPDWTSNDWRHPSATTHHRHQVIARDNASCKTLIAALPEIWDLPVHGELKTGWEDLLRLECNNEPVKSIDDQILSLKTFGELFSWAHDCLLKGGHLGGVSWNGPLDKALGTPERELSATLNARVVRYAFRRMGFPTQIFAVPVRTQPHWPSLRIHVCIPSKRVSFVLGGNQPANIFPVESSFLYTLPAEGSTLDSKLPVFEIPGGGQDNWCPPIPFGN